MTLQGKRFRAVAAKVFRHLVQGPLCGRESDSLERPAGQPLQAFQRK